MIDFVEDYPSPAEGNGLENRQVAEMSRVGSNPTSSLGFTPYVKSRFLADLTTFDVYLSEPQRRAMLERGLLKFLEPMALRIDSITQLVE